MTGPSFRFPERILLASRCTVVRFLTGCSIFLRFQNVFPPEECNHATCEPFVPSRDPRSAPGGREGCFSDTRSERNHSSMSAARLLDLSLTRELQPRPNLFDRPLPAGGIP